MLMTTTVSNAQPGYSYNCYLYILKRAQTYAFIYLSHYQLHWIIVCRKLHSKWKFSLATRAYAAEAARVVDIVRFSLARLCLHMRQFCQSLKFT